jgi:pimeloyl-ACP methyl ester carboxylesterase
MNHTGRSVRTVVDGVGIAYNDCGAGRPVVLVHGLASCAVSWAMVSSVLSRRYRTISIDLMGFGRSDKPLGESYTLERQAELLRLFIADLALDGAVLVGHSYGGGVSLTVADTSCTQLSALVLVDSVCYPQAPPLSFRVLGLPLFGPLALRLVPKSWVTGAVFGSAYGTRIPPTQALVAANALALASATGRHALIQTVRELMSQRSARPADYSHIALPTLILWGRRDPLVPIRLGEKLAAEIPGAQFVAFETCGHLPQEEDPERVAETISRFIDRLPS